jgi:hypothetical protein
MKVVFPLIALLFIGCKNKTTQKDNLYAKDTAAINFTKNVFQHYHKEERKKYHAIKDTVFIYSENKDTLVFSRNDFNDIVDYFPELYDDSTISADATFAKSPVAVDLVDSSGNTTHLSFSSEAGQDEYFILYSYFLKNKNGIAKYSFRRKKLVKIYNDLNNLYGNFSYGGTYFGHQFARINGYAEFSVYWFSHYESFFARSYDITKQKGFYIQGLKQLIRDEVAIDNNANSKKEKAERIKKLFTIVDDLDKLITDNFYLKMAQSFQNEHY